MGEAREEAGGGGGIRDTVRLLMRARRIDFARSTEVVAAILQLGRTTSDDESAVMKCSWGAGAGAVVLHHEGDEAVRGCAIMTDHVPFSEEGGRTLTTID